MRPSAANLALLDRFFEEFKDYFAWVQPTSGVTAFPWSISRENSRTVCEEAARDGALLAPGDCFAIPSDFRVGFAASGADFPKGLKRLVGVVKRIAREPVKPQAAGVCA